VNIYIAHYHFEKISSALLHMHTYNGEFLQFGG